MRLRHLATALFGTIVAVAPLHAPLCAQDLASFEKRTTVKVLPNGLTLIVCERPTAPVFSYFTLVDAGSADDPQGASGLAHMFEHMAFKGTTEIGTTDYPAEKLALAKVEIAYAAYDAELRNHVKQDPAKLESRHKVFLASQADAEKFVIPNQFSEIAEQNGAVGLNASTSEDSTQFFWSMPSNRLELWAYMESSRLAHPVEREFYKERDVVQEERRMRIDSAPTGRMVEQFLATAYVAHPYGSQWRRLGERDQPGHRNRSRRLPQEVLRPRQHRHRHRRRREGKRYHARPRKVLSAPSPPAPSPPQ